MCGWRSNRGGSYTKHKNTCPGAEAEDSGEATVETGLDEPPKKKSRTHVHGGYVLEDQPEMFQASMVAIAGLIKEGALSSDFFQTYMNALDTCAGHQKYDQTPTLSGMGFALLNQAARFGVVPKRSGRHTYPEQVAYLTDNMPPLQLACFVCRCAVDDHRFLCDHVGHIYGCGSVVKTKVKSIIKTEIITDVILYTDEPHSPPGSVTRTLAY